MRATVLRLILEEARADGTSAKKGFAAFRVCERLRTPLSTVVGVAGFRSLLSRAVSLAKKEVPWLAGLEINPDGSFRFNAEMEAAMASEEALQGGLTVVAHVLELLTIFIGEALTLRLVQEAWPKAALKNLKTGE